MMQFIDIYPDIKNINNKCIYICTFISNGLFLQIMVKLLWYLVVPQAY